MSSTLGDELDSLWDGESVRSQSSGRRPLPEDVQFGIPRLMHDLGEVVVRGCFQRHCKLEFFFFR